MTFFDKVKDLLLSPRFMSWYWNMGTIAFVGFLSLIAENLANLGLPAWAVIGIGGFITQLTKAMSNASQGKELGFSKK